MDTMCNTHDIDVPPKGFVIVVKTVSDSKTALLNASRTFTTFPACEIEWGSVNPPPISFVIWICSSQPEIVARTTVQTSDEIVLHLWPTGSEVRLRMNLRETIFGFNPVRRVKNHPVTAGLIPCPSFRALEHIVWGGCRGCRSRCHCRCWCWGWSAWLEVASLAEGGYFLTIYVLVSSKIKNLKMSLLKCIYVKTHPQGMSFHTTLLLFSWKARWAQSMLFPGLVLGLPWPQKASSTA